MTLTRIFGLLSGWPRSTPASKNPRHPASSRPTRTRPAPEASALVLTKTEEGLLDAFRRRLPAVERGGVLDLGSPEGRVGQQVLRQDPENFATYVHRRWERVEDAIVGVGENMGAQPWRRSRISYHLGGISRLDAAKVARHRYITCLLGGENLHGLSADGPIPRPGHPAVLELLDCFAALPVPEDATPPRLLLGVPESWVESVSTSAKTRDLALEETLEETDAGLVILRLRPPLSAT